jgi:hypothetical protein
VSWSTLSREHSQADRHLLDILRQGLTKEFPNPDRIGCPRPTLLRDIARRRVPLEEAKPWLDHLASCSPCYQDFTEFRKQFSSGRRKLQLSLAAAAVFLFGFAGWLWEHNHPAEQTSATAILDLRERSVPRGQNPTETELPPLEIPRSAKHVIVELPIGSREGVYEVALLSNSNEVEPPGGPRVLLSTTGTAQLENHTMVLRADVDLERISPGTYLLGVRQPGLEWTRFPIRVL